VGDLLRGTQVACNDIRESKDLVASAGQLPGDRRVPNLKLYARRVAPISHCAAS
jgi:hypothetical protein